jgi:hypothetical protein
VKLIQYIHQAPLALEALRFFSPSSIGQTVRRPNVLQLPLLRINQHAAR